MACQDAIQIKDLVKDVFKNFAVVIKTGSTSNDRTLPPLDPLKIGRADLENSYSNILDIQLTLTDVTAEGGSIAEPPEDKLQLVHKDSAVTVYATTEFSAFNITGSCTLKGKLPATSFSGEGTFEGHIKKLVVITSFNFADKDTKQGLVKPDLQGASFHEGKAFTDATIELGPELESMPLWFSNLLTTIVMNYMDRSMQEKIHLSLRELTYERLEQNKKDILSALQTVIKDEGN